MCLTDVIVRDPQFKIRMKGMPRIVNTDRSPWSPFETWLTNFQFPVFQLPGPRFKNRTEGGCPGNVLLFLLTGRK